MSEPLCFAREIEGEFYWCGREALEWDLKNNLAGCKPALLSPCDDCIGDFWEQVKRLGDARATRADGREH